MYDVIIIGGGAAGLTAAIYTTRYGLKTVVIEKMVSGGQLNLTEMIENYPGFDEPISGYDLSVRMENQAKKFGVEFIYDEVLSVDLTAKEKKIINTSSDSVVSKTVIIASGANPKHLNIPGEKAFAGKGVSYCGTCDGPMFKGKEVVAIGGGDTALEEACILARHAKVVYLVHRRNTFRAQKIIQDHVYGDSKIKIITPYSPKEILGDTIVRKVVMEHSETKEIKELQCDGVFVFVGTIPNSTIFEGQLTLSENKFIIVDPLMKASINGVWACGDVIEKDFRQISLSVGEGALAANEVYKYLS